MTWHEDHVHTHNHEPLDFPKGFLWGGATSSHQVEGNNIQNDWWEWEQLKGRVKNDERSGKAADQYNRYEEDFDLAQQMNHNAHRLSIEWSRIEPEEGQWNDEAIEHYRDVFAALKKRKMKIMLTLHHFTNPTWFSQRGGWKRADAPDYFVRYVEKVVEEYGDMIDFWCTINEPVVYTSMSFVNGIWPPQENSIVNGFRVFRHLAKAHTRAYKKIHTLLDDPDSDFRPQVGIAKNLISFAIVRNKLFDYLAMRVSDYFWNDYFFKLTKHQHDFIGVNYYFHQRLQHVGGVRFRTMDVRYEGKRDASDLGWEIFAPGLYDILQDLGRYNVPIYITENGIATHNDDKRSRFLIQHMKEVYHAVSSGVDVRGYFYWSLIDNFEWHEGFTPRFGLIGINYDTMVREPRPSSYLFAEIAKNNHISHTMLRLIGHGIDAREVLEETKKKSTKKQSKKK